MSLIKRTLFLNTPGYYIFRRGLTLGVKFQGKVLQQIPIHTVENVIVFGETLISPGALQLCVENNIMITYLSRTGRLIARVEGPASGNIMLRKRQYEASLDPDFCLKFVENVVAAKIKNTRLLYVRALRNTKGGESQIETTISELKKVFEGIPNGDSIQQMFGIEGQAAKIHFGSFKYLISGADAVFQIEGRNKRPPQDATNALLSFGYAILSADVNTALQAAGLDPGIGFFHTERAGRPALALDMMEEWRSLFVDRLVIKLINRRQLAPDGFEKRAGGGIFMQDSVKKVFLQAYHKQKLEVLQHPLYQEKVSWGMHLYIQAKILARHLRGDPPEYIPFVGKT